MKCYQRCLLLLALPAPLLAQQPSIDPPVANRPIDFSNIVGKYTIHVTAAPTDVYVEDPVTLRVVITGAGPEQYQPRREHLRLFPAWDDDFYVQEIRAEHQVDRANKTWTFVYRLRPKHTKVDIIDGIKLVFFNPDKPGKVKFETRRVDPIAIVVKPRPEAIIDVPADATPDLFYRWSDTSVLSSHRPPPLSAFSLTMAWILAGPPAGFALAIWARRRYFPDVARSRQRQRSLAAQRALVNLQAGSDPAWIVMSRYLHDRFDFAVDEPTPSDVAAFLKRRGFAKEACGQALAFFRARDGIVYASGPIPAQLRGDAARLIHTLEGDPCACG